MIENIIRILEPGLGLEIILKVDFTPVFNWLANAGSVDPVEMLKTFNCGIGMVFIIPTASKDLVKQMLESFYDQVLRLALSITRVKYHFQENFVTKKVAIFISGSGSTWSL